jgi:hypothetical protein
MSLTGFPPLWNKILSQSLQAVADQGCHLGAFPYKGTAYRGVYCLHISLVKLQMCLEWYLYSPNCRFGRRPSSPPSQLELPEGDCHMIGFLPPPPMLRGQRSDAPTIGSRIVYWNDF